MTSRVLTAVLAVVALAVAGCSEERESVPEPTSGETPTSQSSAAQSPTASDDLIADVEFLTGRRIHVTCFGPADPAVPTVLLEAGGSLPSDTWDTVMDELSLTRRTCSYDRAGLGASPEAPEPRRTTKHLVVDLEATLEGAGIEGPFVLVSHSMAVLPLTVFTDRHREDVAGMVLVDPRPPRISERFLAALPPPREGEPEAVRVWRQEDLGSFEHDPSLNPEHLNLARTNAEAGSLLGPPGPFFGDIPLILLSASGTNTVWGDLPSDIRKEFDRIHAEEQHALAEESTDGTYLKVSPSGHNIQVEQPQAVIDAIEEVLTSVAVTPR